MAFFPNPPLPPFDVLFAGWATPYPGCPLFASATYMLDQHVLLVRYNDDSLDIYENVPQGVGQATSVLSCLETYFSQAIQGNYVKALTQLAESYSTGTTLVKMATDLDPYYGDTLLISLNNGTQFTTVINMPPAGFSTDWATIAALPSGVTAGSLVADLDLQNQPTPLPLLTELGTIIMTENNQPIYA